VSLVVEQIWRYPIKSMGGEQLHESFADESGLRGDRVWAVQDDTGILHFDEVPFSLVGTATLDWLAGQVTVAVDARRLRPNIVVRTEEPFAEEAWVDRRVRIGSIEAVFDRVFMRCVMVGMAQSGLGESGDVLNRIADRGLCMAISGHICQPGTVRLGDQVIVS
jgi:uncharacterized protein